MAPVKPSSSKIGTKSKSKTISSSFKSKPSRKPLPVSKKDEVKTKRSGPTTISATKRRAKRQYTAEELGVPKLNGIVPAGVQKPRGGKKGKVFVEDGQQVLAILKMVEAEKSKDVESRVMRARQLEEMREARREKEEQKVTEKRERLEEVKREIKGRKKRKDEADGRAEEMKKHETNGEHSKGAARTGKRKKVSFG